MAGLARDLLGGEAAVVGQLGVRHWLKRERLALDVSLQQRRSPDAPRASGFIVGLGWYDL